MEREDVRFGEGGSGRSEVSWTPDRCRIDDHLQFVVWRQRECSDWGEWFGYPIRWEKTLCNLKLGIERRHGRLNAGGLVFYAYPSSIHGVAVQDQAIRGCIRAVGGHPGLRSRG